MKILAINGSPKENGNTALAMQTALKELENEGFETETITLGQKVIRGCIACNWCFAEKKNRCVFDDEVNEILPKMIEADGILLGSPVYYAGINGALKTFLDRAFYVAWANGAPFRLKVGAAIVAARRSGGSTAFDQLNKYFLISEMMVVGSCYWNIAHGMAPGETSQDEEGTNIMKTLGRNMAWMLKSFDQARATVQPPPTPEWIMTNFVR